MKANFHCARLHYLCCCKHKTRNYGTDYNQYPDFGLDNGGTVGLHLMLKKDCKAGFDVILTECPSLRILGYSGYGGQLLDVSKNPLLEFIDWRKRSIPTHSEWLYPLTFDAGKGLKEA